MHVVCAAVREVIADDGVQHKVDALCGDHAAECDACAPRDAAQIVRIVRTLDGKHYVWTGYMHLGTRARRSVVISSHVLPLRKFSMAFRRAACP